MSSDPESVDAEDSLTRFITESGHFASKSVRHKAFEPKFDQQRQRNETSLFRTNGLGAPAIWAIGAAEVEPTRGKPILARARIPGALIARHGLTVADDPPPTRHAVIIGWPEGPDGKSARVSLQQELAAGASLFLRS